MAKKTTKLRPWTKEDVRTLKTLAREKVKTSVIARKLKRTLGSDVSEGNGTRCDVGGRSREEEKDEISWRSGRLDARPNSRQSCPQPPVGQTESAIPSSTLTDMTKRRERSGGSYTILSAPLCMRHAGHSIQFPDLPADA
jgi:hypothetical protein